MYDDFLIVRQLHEMMWYLTDASTFILPKELKEKLHLLIKETEKLTEEPTIVEVDAYR